MKFLTWAVLSLFGMAMLVASHQLIASLMTSHGWEGLKPADWAAWVQAVGSVCAILAAVAIASKQAKSEAEIRRSIRDETEADRLREQRLQELVRMTQITRIWGNIDLMFMRVDTAIDMKKQGIAYHFHEMEGASILARIDETAKFETHMWRADQLNQARNALMTLCGFVANLDTALRNWEGEGDILFNIRHSVAQASETSIRVWGQMFDEVNGQ